MVQGIECDSCDREELNFPLIDASAIIIIKVLCITGDMSRLKLLSILLVLLALGFAAAPSWIDSGASINYTSGGNAISFTVASRTSTEIQIQLTTTSPKTHGTITGNASADSGQFWFDPALLANAYNGETIDDFTVTDTGPQTLAGQSWNTITLQEMISGATSTQIYDVQTGLLLEQTVDADGVPNVVLSKYYIPALAPPPPPPPTNVTPPQNNTPPLPQQNVTNVTQNTTTTQKPNTTAPAQPAPKPSSPAPSKKTTASSSSCCGSSFILLLVGFVTIRGFKR
jgi:hypothetical protein